MNAIARTSAALALLILGVSAARADDSVQQFKTLVEPLLAPATLTYAKATATGAQSLVLEEAVLTPPPGGPADKPISVARVTIDAIDFAGIARGDAPSRLHLHLDGISSEGASAVPPEVTDALGPGPYHANLELDYTLVDVKELRVDTIALDLPGLGRLKASLDIDGIESDNGTITNAVTDNAALRTGTISYEDHSLLAKAIAAFAKAEQKSDEEVIAEWSNALKALATSQGNDESPLLQAVLAFLADYKSPKTPLSLTFTPPRDAAGGHPIQDAMTDGVVKSLGISASYAGATYALPPDTTPKLSGAQAWSALVGNTLFANIDGDEEYDFFAPDGQVHSLEGNDSSTGKWALEDPKVCFEYTDTAKSCYSVEVTGDSAVLVDETGTGTRYKILQGNPKQL